MNAGAELGSWVGESWKSGKIPSCFTNIFWWKICLKIGQNEKKGPPTPHSRNMSNHFFCCTTLSPAKSGPSIFRVDNAWSCCRGSPIFFVEQRLDQRNRINHPFSSKNPLSRHRATSFWVEFGCFWPIKWLIQGHCFRTGDFLSVKNISGGETHRRRPQKILRDFLRENLGVNLMEIGFSRWNGFFWIFFGLSIDWGRIYRVERYPMWMNRCWILDFLKPVDWIPFRWKNHRKRAEIGWFLDEITLFHNFFDDRSRFVFKFRQMEAIFLIFNLSLLQGAVQTSAAPGRGPQQRGPASAVSLHTWGEGRSRKTRSLSLDFWNRFQMLKDSSERGSLVLMFWKRRGR